MRVSVNLHPLPARKQPSSGPPKGDVERLCLQLLFCIFATAGGVLAAGAKLRVEHWANACLIGFNKPNKDLTHGALNNFESWIRRLFRSWF